jgi:hypothetical protein
MRPDFDAVFHEESGNFSTCFPLNGEQISSADNFRVVDDTAPAIGPSQAGTESADQCVTTPATTFERLDIRVFMSSTDITWAVEAARTTRAAW